MWARRYGNLSGALPRDSVLDINDQRVAPGAAEVRTTITSLIYARMGQVRSPSAFTWGEDVDGVVFSSKQRSYNEVMEVWSCWRLLVPHGPNSYERDKRFLDGGLRALPKVLEAYMDETTSPTDPTRSIFGNYASEYCNVVLVTQWSIQEWTFMNENFHI